MFFFFFCGGGGDYACLMVVAIFHIGLNRYCRLSALAPTPVRSKEKEYCKRSYDIRNEEPSFR